MSQVLDNHLWTRAERDALPDDGNPFEVAISPAALRP